MRRPQSSPRLCSKNRPLPSIDEASSDGTRQFKLRLIQETPHVTKFNVRDRTRPARFSVVNYRTGRQCRRKPAHRATVTLSASPASMPSGQSSTLAWTSAGATACSGTGKGFSPSGASGFIAVSPGVTTTYGITCTGADGSASQSVTVAVTAAPTLTIGMTVAAAGPGHDLRLLNANADTPGSAPRRLATRAWSSAVQRAPAWHMVASSLRRRPYRLVHSGRSRVRVTNCADTHVQRESSGVAPGALSTLTWSSTNATSCSGTGFSPSRASGSLFVSPTVSTNYSITCTGSGGSTAQSAAVIVNPAPSFTWNQSLPVTFHASGIVPLGARRLAPLSSWTEACMRGSAIGRILISNPQALAAQVLRLDSPTSGWVEDQNFLQRRRREKRNRGLSGDRRYGDGAFRSRLEQEPDHAGRCPHGRVLEYPCRGAGSRAKNCHDRRFRRAGDVDN